LEQITSKVSFISIFVFSLISSHKFIFALIYKTGAKPVFPSKSDKDKPKFTVKGHKEMTGYPFNKHTFYNVVMVSISTVANYDLPRASKI